MEINDTIASLEHMVQSMVIDDEALPIKGEACRLVKVAIENILKMCRDSDVKQLVARFEMIIRVLFMSKGSSLFDVKCQLFMLTCTACRRLRRRR
jgi:hypothetical protein